MRRATSLIPKPERTGEPAVATVTLAFENRHRRRIRMNDDTGQAFLLDLPEAQVLGDGDGLALADGGIIDIRAATEPVAEVTAETPCELARLAWHIGNRHEPVQVLGDNRLRVRDDHVLIHMLEGLGGRVTRCRAPFAPERGAYSQGHGAHGHDH